MRIADVSDDSIVDGPGMRFVVFTQGCIRLCPECHNPQTQSMDGGRDASVDELFERVRSNPLCSGLTLSGGEPFAQPGECAELARRVRGIGKSVWCFSGYRLEELEDTANIPRTVAVKRRRRTKLDQHDPGFLDGQLVIENDLGAHVDPREVAALLEAIDALVDGMFVAKLKDLTLKWRGSSNQRVWLKDSQRKWRDATADY